MITIGADICKEKIDVYYQSNHFVVKNEAQAIAEYFKKFSGKEYRLVMEATGRYHRLAHKLLCSMDIEVMVINPFQGRNYAKALNILCKTDKVDAKILSQFGDTMPFKATPCASESEEELQNLVRLIDDVKRTRTSYLMRLRGAGGFEKETLERLIELHDDEIKKLEKKLRELTTECEQYREKKEILTSIPGVGESTAIMLISLMKELGALNRNQAGALAGLAPINQDSGKFKGKRSIQKGRFDVRHSLYMPIIGAATRHNKVLKRIYDRMIAKGKPAKIALVACMRKLIIYANSLLKKQEKWHLA